MEIIDKLYLELSTITTARNGRELAMLKIIEEAVRLLEKLNRGHHDPSLSLEIDAFLERSKR